MWKKREDAAPQPGFNANQAPEPTLESVSDGLDEAYRNRYAEAEKSVAAPAPKLQVDTPHASPLGSMGAYTDAVNEFTRSATAFIEQVPLLTKALDAYEQASRISAELRKVLDMGDENLRALMSPLEQVINLRAVRAPEKKKPEPVRVDALRATEDRRPAAYGQTS